jgi:hypothetical protein
MKTGWIVFRIIVSLLVLGLLVFGGFALFRMGWAQGYMTAAATGGTGVPAVTTPPAQPYMHPMYHFGFFGFGMIIPLLLLGFIVLAGLRFIFRPMLWAGMGPHGYMHGCHHGYRGENMPPEWKQWHEQHHQQFYEHHHGQEPHEGQSQPAGEKDQSAKSAE